MDGLNLDDAAGYLYSKGHCLRPVNKVSRIRMFFKLSIMKKIWKHPITRIIKGVLICLVVFIVLQNMMGYILGRTGLDRTYKNLIKGIICSAAIIITYRIYFRWVEKRIITELSGRNVAGKLVWGIGIGVAVQSLTILVIYLFGNYQVNAVNPISYLIIPFAVSFTVAVLEEVLIRGIIFRISEEWAGSYVALFFSTVIFGGLHLLTPHASFIAATCIGIEGGLMMGAAYIYSKSLWLPIAIHFSWNFMQSGIFGAVTSGNDKTPSLFTTKITGPHFITGGGFGPEVSVQAFIFCLLVSSGMMYLNVKKGKLIKYRR